MHTPSDRPVTAERCPRPGPSSPFVELSRSAWASLSPSIPLPLTEPDLDRLRGLGEPIDLAEVQDIYLPLSRLLHLYITATRGLQQATSTFLREETATTPFVVGVAGSVAVGKSTTARVLQALMARWPETPHVELVTTDGFLYPNSELERRGLLHRKGFPESYDRRALLRFVSAVKSGAKNVAAPVYSHLEYDILPETQVVVNQPDVLVVEGLNVLQPARPRADGRVGVAVSDFFDFSIYVDARTVDIRRWYVNRFRQLRNTAFTDPTSYFHRYADLSDAEATAIAETIWAGTNQVNLIENVLPTRGRASLILSKDADHAVQRLLLRKL